MFTVSPSLDSSRDHSSAHASSSRHGASNSRSQVALDKQELREWRECRRPKTTRAVCCRRKVGIPRSRHRTRSIPVPTLNNMRLEVPRAWSRIDRSKNSLFVKPITESVTTRDWHQKDRCISDVSSTTHITAHAQEHARRCNHDQGNPNAKNKTRNMSIRTSDQQNMKEMNSRNSILLRRR